MSNPKPLTVGQVAEFFGVETWRIRRAADSMPGGVGRIGAIRVIERVQLPDLGAELRRRGWLESVATEAVACR